MHWHNIADPKDAELDRLAEKYRLHPLHIEDCRHGNQSAKVEEGSGYLFAVFKTVSDDSDHSVSTCDLDVFLGRDYVITVHSHEAARKLVDQVRAVKQARAEFEKATTEMKYFAVLPADAKPPLDLNKETMDHYRAEMTKFYLNKPVRFN